MRWWCVALVALLAACRAPTEITLEFSTDADCAQLRGVAISVGSPDEVETKAPTTVVTSCGEAGRIGSLVVVPSGAKDALFTVKVVAGVGRSPDECVAPDFGPGCIVARRTIRFVPHQSLRLPIPLRLACNNVICGVNQTCVAGNCRAARVDPGVCIAGRCEETDIPPLGQIFCTPTTMSCDGPVLHVCGPDQRWRPQQTCKIDCGPRGCVSVVGVALGNDATCAWFDDGTVRCWGAATRGELGLGGEERTVTTPRRVPSLLGVRQVVLGGRHACALVGDALEVFCWGDNDLGQVGDGSGQRRVTPTRVPGLGPVAELAAGLDHTCARLVDGAVRCWGQNAQGQLGDGTTLGQGTPVAVTGLSGATRVTAGSRHSCAVVAAGVRCWGHGTEGQLGQRAWASSLTPVAVAELTGVVDIAAGRDHTCVATTAGEARCWGRSDVGETGTPNSAFVPARVGDWSDVVGVAAGIEQSCAVRRSGAVLCWGRVASPLAEVGEAGPAGRVWGGGSHRCALGRDTVLRCWGANRTGQLGIGSTVNADRPTPVAW